MKKKKALKRKKDPGSPSQGRYPGRQCHNLRQEKRTLGSHSIAGSSHTISKQGTGQSMCGNRQAAKTEGLRKGSTFFFCNIFSP
jgi:hypothetical protein